MLHIEQPIIINCVITNLTTNWWLVGGWCFFFGGMQSDFMVVSPDKCGQNDSDKVLAKSYKREHMSAIEEPLIEVISQQRVCVQCIVGQTDSLSDGQTDEWMNNCVYDSSSSSFYQNLAVRPMTSNALIAGDSDNYDEVYPFFHWYQNKSHSDICDSYSRIWQNHKI